MDLLSTDEHGVTLTRSDQTVYQAARPEDLLHAHVGWQVPVTDLRYWVQGIPSPSEFDALELDANGRLIRLHQQGWDIHFERYGNITPAVELPGRLILEHPPLMVRIVVERWFDSW